MGFFKFIFSALNPIEVLKKGKERFEKGGYKTKEEYEEVKAERKKKVNELVGGAKDVYKNPPVWSSIEEMESDWGITDENRERFIGGLNLERTLYFIVGTALFLTLPYVSQTGFTAISLILFKLMAIILCVTKWYVCSWRRHCIKSRVAMNFISYMRGQRG